MTLGSFDILGLTVFGQLLRLTVQIENVSVRLFILLVHHHLVVIFHLAEVVNRLLIHASSTLDIGRWLNECVWISINIECRSRSNDELTFSNGGLYSFKRLV